MPLGRSKTGRNTPKTQGSNNEGAHVTVIEVQPFSRSTCKGNAMRTVARTRRHAPSHNRTWTPTPQSQTPNSTIRLTLSTDGRFFDKSAGADDAKGCAI